MITIKGIAKTAFGVALFALGCSSQVGDPQKESAKASAQSLTTCVDDSDCPGGFRCAFDGVCFTSCDQGHISSICKEGYTCGSLSCDICVLEEEYPDGGPPPPAGPCDDDSDCPGGWACDENVGYCFNGCWQGHASTVCKEGFLCSDDTCSGLSECLPY